MTRTSPWTLTLIGVIGVVVGWLGELLLVTQGLLTIVPPYPLALVLTALAVAVVLAAVPVRRVARGRPGARIDPIVAARIVLLAKAASLAAALFVGLFGSAFVFVLTRQVVSNDQSWKTAVSLVAAIALLAAALVAENMCRIPPRDEDDRGAPDTLPRSSG